MPVVQKAHHQELDALLKLTIAPAQSSDVLDDVAALNEVGRRRLLALAEANHVVMRAFRTFGEQTTSTELAEWARHILAREQQRIVNALTFLHHVCDDLERGGCPNTVIKSLDHWPDLGSDLDLYTTADARRVVQVMLARLGAHIGPRSWGDRLANKWNFAVPGLPESVEVHAQRLGQTGEHRAMAERFVTRRVSKMIEGLIFQVPAPEERIIIATLQRMYRHFYFRVCDIVDTVALLDAGQLDFDELKQAADLGGIWAGVAAYLKIVCDFALRYRGEAPRLPKLVLGSARFGGESVFARGLFLRVPILPLGADLYSRQITSTALRGDLPATLRLSLLPYLASAAAVTFRITGSDKGIW
ncbi:MAG TPA: hypothetical protein VKV05_12825 [Terriglobales bacterium]|nr:hypothetical protein [Terriglobales bacterium]